LKQQFDIIIIGGGLAGLTCAIHLSKRDVSVALIEKNTYPNHKVCGEYVSNEVLAYLIKLGIDPIESKAVKISKFKISNTEGALLQADLPLGGFGISRYALDNLLYKKAKTKTEFIFETVADINFSEDIFTVSTKEKNTFKAKNVVGSFGKRSNIDKKLGRPFFQKKSNWIGIKAHYNFDMPNNEVQLHNFNGGYCGLSKTETGNVNACYLTTYKSYQISKNTIDFQKNIMSQNPYLAEFFSKAVPIFEKPLTISQISFSQKSCIEDHIFMIGDSAGLIHPLCGNGMAMAIHSAKIFSELYLKSQENVTSRDALEVAYVEEWEKNFKKRLRYGRKIQSLLLNPLSAKIGFNTVKAFPSILPKIINKTHGSPII